MHRLMIKMVQAELASADLPCMSPWLDLPALDDKFWPYPRKLLTDDDRQSVESQLAVYRAQLKKLRNPVLLKKITLNRLGELVEPGLHQNMHNFYRGNPVCSREARAQGFCDDLIPFPTSPLNRHFWKLHGLIDSLLGDWLTANNYREISVKCDGRPACYQWQGTWIAK